METVVGLRPAVALVDWRATGRNGQVRWQRAGNSRGLTYVLTLHQFNVSGFVLVGYDLEEILDWDLGVEFGECSRERGYMNDLQSRHVLPVLSHWWKIHVEMGVYYLCAGRSFKHNRERLKWIQ